MAVNVGICVRREKEREVTKEAGVWRDLEGRVAEAIREESEWERERERALNVWQQHCKHRRRVL